MSVAKDDILTDRIAEWRARLSAHGAGGGDLDGLERYLREQADRLVTTGLTPEEAFLIAVKRTGDVSAAAREINHAHGERLWRQLLAARADGIESRPAYARPVVATALALAAAAAIKVPALFGQQFDPGAGAFYARNLSLLVLPPLAALFLCRRTANPVRGAVTVAMLFAAGAVFANVYPFVAGGATEALTAIHLPIALWAAVGLAHGGDGRPATSGRMRFVRFSGEWFIHYALFALGGGVLAFLTATLFDAAGIGVERILEQWLLPCGAAGAVVVAGWLAATRGGVAGQLAPLLARVFTPLFAAVLLAFLASLAWTGRGIDVQRDVLIAFDLLLVLVVGLLLYAVSARDPEAPPDAFDALRLVLAFAALIADAVALAAIAARIGEFGFTANKVAALGVNLLLLAHLGGSGWLHVRFLSGAGSFAAVARWQTAYLPVYVAWAALVAVIFPPLFRYL